MAWEYKDREPFTNTQGGDPCGRLSNSRTYDFCGLYFFLWSTDMGDVEVQYGDTMYYDIKETTQHPDVFMTMEDAIGWCREQAIEYLKKQLELLEAEWHS